VTLGCAKVGLVGDMNLTSFRGSFFFGGVLEDRQWLRGVLISAIKFRYLTGIKKICEEVIRNFHLAQISDSNFSRQVDLT